MPGPLFFRSFRTDCLRINHPSLAAIYMDRRLTGSASFLLPRPNIIAGFTINFPKCRMFQISATYECTQTKKIYNYSIELMDRKFLFIYNSLYCTRRSKKSGLMSGFIDSEMVVQVAALELLLLPNCFSQYSFPT